MAERRSGDVIVIQGSVVRLNPNDLLRTFYIQDSATLSENFSLYHLSTPSKKVMFEVVITNGIIDLNGFTFTFFGTSISQSEFDLGGILRAYWTGSQWVIERISGSAISAFSVTGTGTVSDPFTFVNDLATVPPYHFFGTLETTERGYNEFPEMLLDVIKYGYLIKHNWDKTLTVDENLDSADGFDVGSTVCDTNGDFWKCEDNTLGAAVWDKISNSLSFPSLNVGDVDGGNYLEINSDGTIILHGNARVWRDEFSSLLLAPKVTPADDIVLDIPEGAVYYKVTATMADYGIMNIQFNHDRELFVACKLHLHWWQTTANMPNWVAQYRIQYNGELKTTAWTTIKHISNAFTWSTGTLNQITRFTDITPSADDGVSTVLQIRLIRDVDDESELFGSGDPYVPSVDPVNASVYAYLLDAHIICDNLGGSDDEYQKTT